MNYDMIQAVRQSCFLCSLPQPGLGVGILWDFCETLLLVLHISLRWLYSRIKEV